MLDGGLALDEETARQLTVGRYVFNLKDHFLLCAQRTKHLVHFGHRLYLALDELLLFLLGFILRQRCHIFMHQLAEINVLLLFLVVLIVSALLDDGVEHAGHFLGEER